MLSPHGKFENDNPCSAKEEFLGWHLNMKTYLFRFCLLCDKQFVVLLLHLTVPFPAPANAGDSLVYAGQEDEQLEHDDHAGHNQAEHVTRRHVPVVPGDIEELLGAVQVRVQGAEEERQVTQLGLEDENNQVRQTDRPTDGCSTNFHTVSI